MTIEGLPGTGKTFSALSLLTHLTDRIAVLDTENGRSGEYIGEETRDGATLIYDTCIVSETSPEQIIEAINVAEHEGYGGLVIDSFSAEWGALLQEKDDIVRKSRQKDFYVWGTLSPRHSRVIQAVNAANLHIILTIRAKIGHEVFTVESDGGKKSTEVVEIGLQPIQRPETPYEFSFRGIIDHEHDLTFAKSPCPELFEQAFNRPGQDVATTLKAWLTKGGQPTPAEELKRICRLKGYSHLKLAGWLSRYWGVDEGDLSDMLSAAEPKQIEAAIKKFMDVPVNKG
jgi:hypothetical protein